MWKCSINEINDLSTFIHDVGYDLIENPQEQTVNGEIKLIENLLDLLNKQRKLMETNGERTTIKQDKFIKKICKKLQIEIPILNKEEAIEWIGEHIELYKDNE